MSQIDRLARSWIVNALDTTGVPIGTTAADDRFDLLFQTHYRRLARVVGRIVHDQARAEEIAADVFIRWRGHPSAHGAGAEGWLYRTAARQALDAWRRDRRWSRVERVLAHLGIAPSTPADLHAGAAERRQVRAVLASLRRREATLLLLWVEDVSYADMASAIAVQPASVGSLVRRAQEAFRKEYEARKDSHPETPQWTAARLAAIAPAWEPDLRRAEWRIGRRPAVRSRRALYLAAAATAALIVAFVSPSGRALAQDLWYRLYASRIAVVRLDLSHNPLETSIHSNGQSVGVDSIQAAADAAGFTPYLPRVDGLPEPPVLHVLGRLEMTQTLRVPRLRSALAAAGVADLEVPGEWDGVRLRADIGPIVSAKYVVDRSPAGTDRAFEIVQLPAVKLEMPADFPLARLAEIVFRSGGSSWWEARRLGEEYADNPAWLFDVPADAPVTVEEIALPRGNALLLEFLDDDDDAGSVRTLVLIGRPWRLYGIVGSGSDRELALRVAAALP